MQKIIKRFLPNKVIKCAKGVRQKIRKSTFDILPPLSETRFLEILTKDLGILNGDIVMVHSSVDSLCLSFPFYKTLSLLRTVLGKEGTLVVPTYNNISSLEFLNSGQIFDVRRTPSYTGILSEFLRLQKDSIRSLHPTKSVCAQGPAAKELTNTHKKSLYPYDGNSPYSKLINRGGKIIGLGVTSFFLSAIHSVDDALLQKNEFPVQPYHDKLFKASCINYNGETETVRTYAHDTRKMDFDIPKFFNKYLPGKVCKDIKIDRRNVFVVDGQEMFIELTKLAQTGITIYKKQFYTG